MKKLFFLVAMTVTTFIQHSYAQVANQQSSLSQLLHSYYDIKDALVAGSAATASSKATDFVKHFTEIDSKVLPLKNSTALLKDANQISESKDIKHQREHFANFSVNMFALAKSVKLTSDPIYEAYCPMKKAYWLSSDKVIKNPYFGSAMLTCGSIKETLK